VTVPLGQKDQQGGGVPDLHTRQGVVSLFHGLPGFHQLPLGGRQLHQHLAVSRRRP